MLIFSRVKTWLSDQVNRSEYVKNVAILSTGTSLAQLIPILVSPILTRIYTPEEFGTLGLFTATVQLSTIFATAKYELAILVADGRGKAKNIIRSIILINFGFILLFVTLLLGYPQFIRLIFKTSHISWIVWLLPVAILISGFIKTMTYWNNRNKRYKINATSQSMRSFTTSGVSMGLGFYNIIPNGLIIGYFCGQFIELMLLIRNNLFKSLKQTLCGYHRKNIKRTFYEFNDFPKYSLPSNLLNTFSLQMPIYFLNIFFDRFVVGSFFQAYKIMSLPTSFVGNAISQVFFQRSTELKDNPSELKGHIQRTYRRLLQIGVIPISIVTIYGDLLFPIIFGEEWRDSGVFAQIISPWLLLSFIASPLTTVLVTLRKQRINLIFNTSIFVFRILFLILGYYLFKTDVLTVLAYSCSGFILWAFYNGYILHVVGLNWLKEVLRSFAIIAITLFLFGLFRFILI